MDLWVPAPENDAEFKWKVRVGWTVSTFYFYSNVPYLDKLVNIAELDALTYTYFG